MTGVTITSTGTSAGGHWVVKELAWGTQPCPGGLKRETCPCPGGKDLEEGRAISLPCWRWSMREEICPTLGL